MKTIINLFFIMTLSIQLMSQVINFKSVNTPGDIAIISIKHPCVGTVNGIDTTLGYFSALPVNQVWPIQLSASIANIGPNDQTNVVLSAEIVNESGTIVYSSSENAGNMLAGGSLQIILADNFLPAAVGTYTLTMSVTQDEGDYDVTNNEVIRQIIEINQNDVIARYFELNSSMEIPTGNPLSSLAGIQFAIPDGGEVISLSVYVDTVIQSQIFLTAYLFDLISLPPVIQVVSEAIELTASMSHSWIEIPFFPMNLSDDDLDNNHRYLVCVEAYSMNGIGFLGSDSADFHDFDDETYFSGYYLASARIPAMKINLKNYTHADTPNLGEQIHLFPNPVTSMMNIALDQNAELPEVSIYSSTGQVLTTCSCTQVDFQSFPTGLYLVKITLSSGSTLQKVMKI